MKGCFGPNQRNFSETFNGRSAGSIEHDMNTEQSLSKRS